MQTITAKILELSIPIAAPTAQYIQVSIPDTEEEEKLWLEAGKRHFLEAYAEEDAIYDKL